MIPTRVEEIAKLQNTLFLMEQACRIAFYDSFLRKVWHKDFCNVRNSETKTCECGFGYIEQFLKD